MKEIAEKILNCHKIAVFGWPATGKSTLSEKLSNALNIHHYSLDVLRWDNYVDGEKNDEAFLLEYSEILKKEKWIIDGNALDWIDSRLESADMLIFFESTIENCINNYCNRELKITNKQETRKSFNEEKKKSNEETVNWIKNRYARKVDYLRIKLLDYKDKLVIINNYNELDQFLNIIDDI